MSSKHRAVDVSNFQEVEFLVLEGVIARYGVKPFDFVYQAVPQVARNCFFASVGSNHDGADGTAPPRTDTQNGLPTQAPRIRIS